MSTERRADLIDIFLAVVLVGLSMFAFRSVLDAGFVNYDDPAYVTANANVQNGNVAWAFQTFAVSNWHPLTWLSHMLDCALFGLEPTGHHLTNLLLHSANGVLLFFLLLSTTGSRWRSALVAALFLIHPLHVESVAWVSERKDVLSTFFGMLSIFFYTRYAKNSSIFQLGGSWICLALSLMAKPMLVTMPFLLLLMDVWPLNRFSGKPHIWRRLLLEKIPFFVLSIASSVVTLAAQKAEVATVEALPFMTRLANSAVSYVLYLAKTLWPAELAAFYPYTIHPIGLIITSFLILGAVTFVLCGKWHANRASLAVGWFWYLGTLVPVIGLVQVGHQSIADRYTYVPLIGIFIVAAWSIPSDWVKREPLRKIIIILSSILILAYVGRTDHQSRFWKSSETLFAHALEVTTNSYVAFNNYGIALAERGEPSLAIPNFRKSIEIYPGNAKAHFNLGGALYQQGQLEQAREAFSETLKYEPEHTGARNWLGLILAGEKRYAEAERELRTVLELEPQNLDGHINLAFVKERQGDLEQAASLYARAIELSPENADLYFRSGTILLKLQHTSKAIAQLRIAVSLNPQHVPAWLQFSSAAESIGDLIAARSSLEEILRLHPDHPEARVRLDRLSGR